MTRRLLIVQGRVPSYRLPFFRALTAELDSLGWTLDVACTLGQHDRQDVVADPLVTLVPDRLGGLTNDRLRAPRLKNMPPPDVLIFEQAVKSLTTWAHLVGSQAHRRRIGLWGQGDPVGARPAADRARLWLTRRSSWFFAYTEQGADYVIERGYPAQRVSVLNNTIDTVSLRSTLRDVSQEEIAAFTATHAVVSDRCALFIGGVDAAKDIDFLLQMAHHAALQDPLFTLLFIGDGADAQKVRNAQACGLPVRFLGHTTGRQKAVALSVARVLLIPNWIGLVSVESLVAGVPIVTRDNGSHAPESAYLRPGVDSVWLPGDVSPADYARQVVDLLKGRQVNELRAACLRRSHDYELSDMVDRFVEGVLGLWRYAGGRP